MTAGRLLQRETPGIGLLPIIFDPHRNVTLLGHSHMPQAQRRVPPPLLFEQLAALQIHRAKARFFRAECAPLGNADMGLRGGGH